LSPEPENLVLELLRGIRADVARVDGKIDAVKLELRSEIQSLRADVAADFVEVRKEFVAVRKEGRADRRAAPGGGRISFRGSGPRVLISELEARVRRIERHLSLPEADTH
jgi:hypothetical protein